MCGAGKRTGLALRLGLLADAGGGVGISAVGTAHGIEVEVAHFRRRDLLGTLRAAVAEVVGGEFVFGAAHTRQYRAKKWRRFTTKKRTKCLHSSCPAPCIWAERNLGELYRIWWRGRTSQLRHHPFGLLVYLLPERDRSGQYRDQRDEDTKDLLQLRQQPSTATMGCLHG